MCKNVGLMNLFMEQPSVYNLLSTKRILRYVRGTTDLGILKTNRKNRKDDAMIFGYSDSY